MVLASYTSSAEERNISNYIQSSPPTGRCQLDSLPPKKGGGGRTRTRSPPVVQRQLHFPSELLSEVEQSARRFARHNCGQPARDHRHHNYRSRVVGLSPFSKRHYMPRRKVFCVWGENKMDSMSLVKCTMTDFRSAISSYLLM